MRRNKAHDEDQDKDNEHQGRTEEDVAQELRDLNSSIKGLMEAYGEDLSSEQQESLKAVIHLDHALKGPDAKLDLESYSRALPPSRGKF